jgi:hypothetical protein
MTAKRRTEVVLFHLGAFYYQQFRGFYCPLFSRIKHPYTRAITTTYIQLRAMYQPPQYVSNQTMFIYIYIFVYLFVHRTVKNTGQRRTQDDAEHRTMQETGLRRSQDGTEHKTTEDTGRRRTSGRRRIHDGAGDTGRRNIQDTRPRSIQDDAGHRTWQQPRRRRTLSE